MNKIETKNLFIEIRDKDFIILAGEYDEELNFKVLEKETVSSFGILNCKIIDLNKCVDDLKTGIQKIENKINYLFETVNVITNFFDCDCVSVSGFKKLNGNQILSDDISFILNDIMIFIHY